MKVLCDRFQWNWDDHLSLIYFSYNNSYYSRIVMASFELLHGWMFQSPVKWKFDVGDFDLLCPNIVYEVTEKVSLVTNMFKTAYNWQKSYVDHRKWHLKFVVGVLIYFNISSIIRENTVWEEGETKSLLFGPLWNLKWIG